MQWIEGVYLLADIKELKDRLFSCYSEIGARLHGKTELPDEDVARVLWSLHCPRHQLRLLKIPPTSWPSPLDCPHSYWVNENTKFASLLWTWLFLDRDPGTILMITLIDFVLWRLDSSFGGKIINDHDDLSKNTLKSKARKAVLRFFKRKMVSTSSSRAQMTLIMVLLMIINAQIMSQCYLSHHFLNLTPNVSGSSYQSTCRQSTTLIGKTISPSPPLR